MKQEGRFLNEKIRKSNTNRYEYESKIDDQHDEGFFHK